MGILEKYGQVPLWESKTLPDILTVSNVVQLIAPDDPQQKQRWISAILSALSDGSLTPAKEEKAFESFQNSYNFIVGTHSDGTGTVVRLHRADFWEWLLREGEKDLSNKPPLARWLASSSAVTKDPSDQSPIPSRIESPERAKKMADTRHSPANESKDKVKQLAEPLIMRGRLNHAEIARELARTMNHGLSEKQIKKAVKEKCIAMGRKDLIFGVPEYRNPKSA
jgi:hypothetical protein